MAYIINHLSLTTSEIKEFLKTYLPAYMIPGQFIFVDSLPTLPSGKMDRKALSSKKIFSKNQKHFNENMQKIITNVWCDILEIPITKVNENTHFFDIGGNSLEAVQVSIRLSHHYQIQIPIQLIYEHPTFKEYYEAIMNITNQKEHYVESTRY